MPDAEESDYTPPPPIDRVRGVLSPRTLLLILLGIGAFMVIGALLLFVATAILGLLG